MQAAATAKLKRRIKTHRVKLIVAFLFGKIFAITINEYVGHFPTTVL